MTPLQKLFSPLYRFVTASLHFAGRLGHSDGALGAGGAASEQAPYPAVAVARLLPQLHAQLAAEGADDGAVAAEGQLEVEAAARGRARARQHAPAERRVLPARRVQRV